MSTTLGRAALVVSGGILLSRLLGFLREVVLAAALGRSIEADLYQNAFAIPDFVFFLMAGGYLTITFVPIISRYLADGDPVAANRSFTAVFRIVGALMVVVTLVVMAAAEPLTKSVFVNVPDEAIPELVSLVRIVLPAQVFFVLGSLLMAVQYAHRRFLIPSLAPIVYNVAIIIGGLVTAGRGEASPAGFIWGALVGAIVGNFGLQWWGAHRLGTRLERGVPFVHESVPEYFTLALPLMLGQSAVALDDVFARVFGALGGVGDVSGLNYARRVNMLPVGVIAQAAGVAAYPFLTRLFAEGKLDEMGATVARAVRSGLVVAGLGVAGTIALAVPLTQVAYQRGQFTADDTIAVAGLLAIYAVSIPLWAAHQIYTRAFYAQRRMWLPVGIGTATTVLAVPLYLYGATMWGAPGVATASVTVMVVYTLAVGGWWHHTHSQGGVVATAARASVAAIPAGGVAWAVAQLMGADAPASPGIAVGSLAAGGVLAAAVYLGVLRLVRAPELSMLPSFRGGRPDGRGR